MAKVDIVFPTQTPLAAKFTVSHEAKERFEVVNWKGMVIIKKQRGRQIKSASITSTYSEGLY
jgi:hypothetical protein